MAEAMFGIDPRLIDKAKQKIPDEFKKVIDKAYNKKQRDEDFER